MASPAVRDAAHRQTIIEYLQNSETMGGGAGRLNALACERVAGEEGNL